MVLSVKCCSISLGKYPFLRAISSIITGEITILNVPSVFKKWAFAADVVRFYAVYTEGGIYMDSDIFIKKRFDSFIPEHGFATFHEHIGDRLKLQAAFCQKL